MFSVNQILFLLFGFCLPFSVAFCYLLLGLMVLSALFRKNSHNYRSLIRTHPLTGWGIAWLILHLLGLLWTPLLEDSLTPLKKSIYMAMIPCLMFSIQPRKDLEKGLFAFVCGIFIYHLLTHGIVFGWWSVEYMQYGGTPFINRTQYSPMLVFSILILFFLQRNWNPPARAMSFLVQISFLISLVTTKGRTGMAVLVILVGLWVIMEAKSIRKFLWVFGAAMLSFLFLCFYVPSFQAGIEDLRIGWKNYQSQNTRSSLGERLHHVDAGLRLFWKSPWFGHGTGSYPSEHKKLLQSHYPPGTIDSDHPHNQYLAAMVQHGLVGLILLLSLFPILIRAYFQIPNHPARPLLALFPVMFLLLCMTDESVYSVPSLTFFMYLSSLLYHPDWMSKHQELKD
ncbi:MAG: O-antigen ligase family protein [Nitrospinae bacterium]|nr:O-antigen ligase family protein [Nitrospinota bacterium]